MNSVRFLSARKYSNIILKKIETRFNALFCIRRKVVFNCLFDLHIDTNYIITPDSSKGTGVFHYLPRFL